MISVHSNEIDINFLHSQKVHVFLAISVSSLIQAPALISCCSDIIAVLPKVVFICSVWFSFNIGRKIWHFPLFYYRIFVYRVSENWAAPINLSRA